MPRKQHPNKEIEAAIQVAEKSGWLAKHTGSSSHAWGRLLCPLHTTEGCAFSIWSTPRNTENHARQIIRRIYSCPHPGNKEDILDEKKLSIHFNLEEC